MNVPEMFTRSVERTPDRIALTSPTGDRGYTYAELAEAVYAVANSLRDLGVERGDRVAVAMTNSIDHVILNLGTQHCGGVVVPFNYRSSRGRVEHYLSESDPVVFAYDDGLEADLEQFYEELSVSTFVDAADAPDAFARPFSALLDGSSDRPDVDLGSDDLSVILYTSGTTGLPKGVPLDHRASVFRAIDTSLAQGSYVEGDTTVSTMPLYHTIGLHSNCLSRLLLSGTFVPMPEFDPAAYLAAIDRTEATVLFTAPTILNQLLHCDAIDDADLGSVRLLGYGGEPISEHLVDLAREQFAPDRLVNIYGTTETYHPLALIHPTHSGRNGAFYRRRIVELGSEDPHAEVSPGETGELIISTDSPIVFNGYWENSEETAAAIHDGWFFTGDTAFETETGETAISGRADDTIISGGENIHPSEVEDVLISHPDVVDVGVTGVDDERWGTAVKAFVVVDGDVTADELDEWCKASDRLDNFKRPRAYAFVDELPRNPSGKVLRHELEGSS
ncbi:class I adenylate-forming enzyme family protein [Halobellus captivus]|uniref:class I adenylate-forming enzyme family protein n=1 Tax=Halobellus captivus TaxID=2592614 RepID=UPI001396ACBC|nr:class I adenylate-forming enzyme family protein [Halobellus captivus]